jgi:hypothetical protein
VFTVACRTTGRLNATGMTRLFLALEIVEFMLVFLYEGVCCVLTFLLKLCAIKFQGLNFFIMVSLDNLIMPQNKHLSLNLTIRQYLIIKTIYIHLKKL